MWIKQPWRLQQLNVYAVLASWSQFACPFTSSLSIRGGFLPLLLDFSRVAPTTGSHV
jgi:hypothetical protein